MKLNHTFRIIVNDHSGHAFPVQLSRALAGRGHQVLHTYSTSFQTPKGPLMKRGDDPQGFDIQGIKLSKPFNKYSLVRRTLQEREYAFHIVDAIKAFKPDVVISGNTPLEAQNVILKGSRREHAKFVFWAQDIYSVAITMIAQAKLPLVGSLVGLYYERLERNQLKRSDAVISITDDFLQLFQQWRVDHSKCWTIHNWAPLHEMPRQPKVNEWSRKHGLDKKTCIMYSGTLGMKHNPEILLQVARHFRRDENIAVVVASEGLGASWLEKKKNEENLTNLILLPFQPFDVLPKMLSAADVFLGILEPGAGVFSVPSKVLTYMCFERPIVLAAPQENLSSKIIEACGGGKQVHPHNITGIIKEIETLLSESSLRMTMGANALAYAEKHFDITRIAEKFEHILEQLS